ncbi:hypothetical protein M8J76_007071 [Diaphorina citri]|nr:hypothetical protein M8J75_012221 [Diaphorina citri]KAI5740773.1 hypothetical protein M8J76_007071 [Diaphorina citri]
MGPRDIVQWLLNILYCYCAIMNLIFFAVAITLISMIFGFLYRLKIMTILFSELLLPSGDWIGRITEAMRNTKYKQA